MASHEKRTAWGLALLSSMLLTACAGAQREPMAQINDPNEATNRQALAVNQAVFGPISAGYHAVTPSIIRQGIGNVSANLNEPRIFANDLLQLRFSALATTAARFVVNSTFGLGGIFDVATQGGLAKQTGDFGQTLFVWGVDDGPYLVSPYVGPSTARDAVGFVVDEAGDPVGWALGAAFGYPAIAGLAGIGFVTQVDQLKQAENSSIDFYSFLRSSYYQTRRAQLREAIGLPANVESPAETNSATSGASVKCAAQAPDLERITGRGRSITRQATAECVGAVR
ncbi:MAG TPA: VacJ family lipoprotein [Roseiarcus sp.]|nr:VacJ family lipoprotein [Roseiarcus sp.]